MFWLEVTPFGVAKVYFPKERFKKRVAQTVPPAIRKILTQTEDWLKRFLKGAPTRTFPLLDLRGLTVFQKKVLQTLRQIPAGQVLSYSELARKSGYPKAARAVGSVMRRNPLPLFIPCHRVIRTGKLLGNYSKGIEWKRRLLGKEGISTVFKNGLLRLK